MLRSAVHVAREGDCEDKIFLVTGGYSGIGRVTVEALLQKGARTVICAGRNPKLQEAFVESVDSERLDGSLTIDLSDLESVKEFGLQVRKKYSKIDGLILNAGQMNTPISYTKQGIEQQFGVNVVGHFLLAKLLQPITQRQVWVSSYGHTLRGAPRLDLDRLEATTAETYDGWFAYQQSKLGNILLAREFSKRYPHLEAVSLHPGTIYTPLYRSTGLISAARLTISMIPAVLRGDLFQVFPKLPSAGAATTVLCATHSIEDGKYYSNCAVCPTAPCAENMDDAVTLFEFCDKRTKEYQN